MTIYLVSYDLIGPTRDYDRITKHLLTYGTRAKPLESVWLIQSNLTAEAVRDAARQHLDTNDKIMVVQVGGGWGTANITKEVTDWMHNQI